MVPGNSPCYLGLPEWDCCGTQGLLESPQEADSMRPTSKSESTVNGDDKTTKPMAKKQKVSLQLCKDKKIVLSPSSRFNTTVSNEEVDHSSKGTTVHSWSLPCAVKNALSPGSYDKYRLLHKSTYLRYFFRPR